MKHNSDEFVPAASHAPLSTGEVIRLLREAFGVHPAIIMFPEYEAESIRDAAA